MKLGSSYEIGLALKVESTGIGWRRWSSRRNLSLDFPIVVQLTIPLQWVDFLLTIPPQCIAYLVKIISYLTR